MNHALFILGMHRSGTSALARVVNLLGADLGQHLMQAADDNPKGFYEHEPIVAIHEHLLTELGLSWKDPSPLPEGWLQSEAAQHTQSALSEIIDQEFTNTPLWALKDPRQCRLMPLWMPLLQERQITPSFLIAWRSPAEVAASLQKRGDMPEAAALLCWLSYTLEALEAAAGHPHAIISYDDLLQHWQPVMEQAGAALPFDWPVSPENAAAEVNDFLSPELRHHRSKAGGYPLPVESLLALLQSDRPTQPDQLATIAQPHWQQLAGMDHLLREARLEGTHRQQQQFAAEKQRRAAAHALEDQKTQFAQLQARYEQACARINALEAAEERCQDLQAELEALYASKSWQVTAPLRQAAAWLAAKKDGKHTSS